MGSQEVLRDILEDMLELKYGMTPSERARVANFLIDRQINSVDAAHEIPELQVLPCLILGQTLIFLTQEKGLFIRRCLFWNLQDKNRHLMEINGGKKRNQMQLDAPVALTARAAVAEVVSSCDERES